MIKSMIYKIQAWAMLLLVLAFGACTDDWDTGRTGMIDENGMVRLNIQTQVPGLKLTRSIDVNGEAIATLWLVAFNESGNMISRVQATLTENNVGPEGGTGKFTASVPSSTRSLHLLANVNMDNFVDADYIGRSESEVIAPMVSSSGNLVYWGRKTFTSEEDLTDFAAQPTEAITLYRNQAQVKYTVAPGSGLEVLGWAACNQYAYGTVAPYPFDFDLQTNDFVTALPEAYNVKATDPREVNQNEADGDPRYVFETPNPENDQLYVIMRIKKTVDSSDKYYKIMLVDENKVPYQIIRNHQYIINISDVKTSFGEDTFEKAKNATPANNPWITVDDVIPEVINGNTTLRIEGQTTVVYQEAGEKTIDFYYNGGSDGLEIKWISNPGVATGEPVVTWTSSTDGKITLQVPEPPANGILEGTLSIREKNGVLSRRVKVLLCKPFEFTPVWVSSEIPLLDGENISVLFEIPDNYPQELLPVQVKFGCDLIDAQKGETNKLDVISEETTYKVPVYENNNWVTKEIKMDWNYKYVYTATHTGKHRVNFRTILTNIESGSGVDAQEDFHIFMEGCAASTNQSLFEQRALYFAFQPKNDPRYRIMLGNSDSEASTTRFSTYSVENLDPVYGQEFSVPFTLGTLTNDNSADGSNTWRNVRSNLQDDTKLWVYYDPKLVSFLGDNGEKIDEVNTDYFGNTYSEYTPSSANGELKFRTIQPNFDCDIVISAKSTTRYGQFGTGGPNLGINERGYRSAAISVKSSGSLDFNPTFSNDGTSFSSATTSGEWQELPYGTNQDFYLKIQIPNKAQGKAFQVHLKTSNLTPVSTLDSDGEWTAMDDEAEGKGWIYTFNSGLSLTEKTFHFQTNRLAVTETLTLSSGMYVGFNPVSVTLSNTPLTGTLQLPDDVTFKTNSPFVILERKDGTRIGVFTLPQEDLTNASSANYSLTLRGEYNLTENDEVTVKWSPINSSEMYSHTFTHLSEIMENNVTIVLNEQ
ncbi:hypothetical protein I6E18_03545 [Phocaeicola barnesiae]|uniref:hypothetical protein n=1 Tax=Phocaeicola barnesiae TaxID=376804 RepID=UPI001F48AB41|nr:hypothetical protein [Phocaeicola barnesiae]MCF2575264.1 hypothetical protein [Phocaeicola barnesiae]